MNLYVSVCTKIMIRVNETLIPVLHTQRCVYIINKELCGIDKSLDITAVIRCLVVCIYV